VFDFSRQRAFVAEFSKPASSTPTQRKPLPAVAASPMSSRRGETSGVPRELPDVTGFLVVVLVTLGLFVVPVGATIMQGPAIVASILGR
jgi:hypothetical protein